MHLKTITGKCILASLFASVIASSKLLRLIEPQRLFTPVMFAKEQQCKKYDQIYCMLAWFCFCPNFYWNNNQWKAFFLLYPSSSTCMNPRLSRDSKFTHFWSDWNDSNGSHTVVLQLVVQVWFKDHRKLLPLSHKILSHFVSK